MSKGDASMGETQMGGHQRAANIDGHGLNHSYKNPSATGKENLSYLHPHSHGGQLDFNQPWQTADKALQEAGRPTEQLGPSKTVLPVSTEKQRGQPARPAFAKASRGPSHTPGLPSGPAKPTTF
jgi:hypothetical protein